MNEVRQAGRQTVLAMAATRRLAVAAALLAVLWLAVGWALDWWM
jgi:hypothetical protein